MVQYITAATGVLLLTVAGLAQTVALTYQDIQVCLTNSTDFVVTQLLAKNLSVTAAQELVSASLQNYGSACLGVDLSPQPIRILVPLITLHATWKKRAAQFEQETGIRVVLETANTADINSEILSQITGTSAYDGWVFDPSALGAMVESKALADLSNWVVDSDTLQFYDYVRFQRQVSAVYNKRTVAIPLDGRLMLLYYRADLFNLYNLKVPQTWDEVLAVAKKMNGTVAPGNADPLYGACFDMAPNCKGGYLLAAVAGSYIQSEGSTQGFWFDPDVDLPALRPLCNNPGMEAALRFWRDITPYTNPVPTCAAANSDFQDGDCLLTVNWGEELHALSANTLLNESGSVAVAALPGSTRVFNRATGKLEPCNQVLCPLSKPYTYPDGSQGWLNTAPFPAFGGWMAGVSNFTSFGNQRKAFQFFAFMASANNSWEDVLNRFNDVDPYRDEELTDVDRWVEAGYSRPLISSYLEATKTSFADPNIFLDARMVSGDVAEDTAGLVRVVQSPAFGPTSPGYKALFDAAFRNATDISSTSVPLQTIMQRLQTAFIVAGNGAIFKYYGSSAVAMAQQYWYLIGRTGSVAALLASRGAAAQDTQESGGLTTAVIAIVSVVPAIACVGIVALIIVLWMRSRQAHKHLTLTGKVLAPGLGEQTTLVITDVQDSTNLFEALPVCVMDEVMDIACNIIRSCALHHTGYECKTEGDSFTLAFHTARDAALFCVDLQVALLEADWPSELLTCEDVPSVHPERVVPGPDALACMQLLRVTASSVLNRVVSKQSQLGESKLATICYKLFPWCRPKQRMDLAIGPATSYISPSRASTSRASMGGQSLLDMIQDEMDDMSDDAGDKMTRKSTASSVPDSQKIDVALDGMHSITLGALGAVAGRAFELMVPKTPQTFKELLARGWQLGLQYDDISPDSRLIFNGLRVRCGVSSGLHNPADILYSKDTGRTSYTGDFLAGAKVMESCCHGAQVALDLSTFNLLERKKLPAEVILVHMGKHLIGAQGPPADAATAAQLTRGARAPAEVFSQSTEISRAEYEPVADYMLNPLGPDWHHVYSIMHVSQVARLALIPPIKVENTIVHGVTHAPLGDITIVFLSMVGASTLYAWDSDRTGAALILFASIAKQHLRMLDGYLVEHNEGFMLAAFHNPFSAMLWVLKLQADMLHAPWAPSLLKHMLAEELTVPHVDAQGNHSNIVLMRGPRIKAGMSSGVTKSEVHPAIARVGYRGKVMNRAARIAATANTGQILCDSMTWEVGAVAAGYPIDTSRACGMTCLRIGDVHLKGIKEKIQLCQVHLSDDLALHGPQMPTMPAAKAGRVRRTSTTTVIPTSPDPSASTTHTP